MPIRITRRAILLSLSLFVMAPHGYANDAIRCFAADGDAHERFAACSSTIDATSDADPRTRAVAYLNRGVALRELGNYAKALMDFDEAAKLDPNDPAVHLERGKVAVLAGRDDLALAALGQSIALDLRIAEAYAARGAILSRQGQASAARRDFVTAVSLEPQDVSLRLLAGQAHLDAGDLPLALDAFEAAVHLEPTNIAGLFGRGSVQAALGNMAGAITDFSELLALQGPSFRALFNRGNAYLAANEPVRAIADLTAALTFDPAHAGTHYLRGRAAVAAEDYDLAVNDFTAALRLDPLMGDALAARADTHIKGFDFPAARADTSALVEALPSAAKPWRLRGRVRFYQGDFVGAADDFLTATRRPDTELTDDLWLYLAQRRAGLVDVPLSEKARAVPLNQWPAPLLNLAAGRLTARDARDVVVFGATEVQTRLCDIAFVTGQVFILDKDPTAARANLRDAVSLGDDRCLGYRAALIELERLGPDGN